MKRFLVWLGVLAPDVLDEEDLLNLRKAVREGIKEGFNDWRRDGIDRGDAQAGRGE